MQLTININYPVHGKVLDRVWIAIIITQHATYNIAEVKFYWKKPLSNSTGKCRRKQWKDEENMEEM
jgi:hypothetical protein